VRERVHKTNRFQQHLIAHYKRKDDKSVRTLFPRHWTAGHNVTTKVANWKGFSSRRKDRPSSHIACLDVRSSMMLHLRNNNNNLVSNDLGHFIFSVLQEAMKRILKQKSLCLISLRLCCTLRMLAKT